jgi:hypothetical protein
MSVDANGAILGIPWHPIFRIPASAIDETVDYVVYNPDGSKPKIGSLTKKTAN